MHFNKLLPAAAAALSLTVLSLTALAGPAFAGASEDAFEGFHSVCAAGGTDFPAVVAAADAGA